MPHAELFIKTEGMKAMENDFALLATPAPISYAKERLSDNAKIGFEGVQAAIPADAGDYRRPGGSLRDSARYTMTDEGDYWEFTLMVGTNDDAVPYAKWVLYKNIRKPGGDYLEPMEAVESGMEGAMNEAFDSVFGQD